MNGIAAVMAVAFMLFPCVTFAGDLPMDGPNVTGSESSLALEWQQLSDLDRMHRLDAIAIRLNDCRTRFPGHEAYEYPVLKARVDSVNAGIRRLSENPDDCIAAARALSAIGALEGYVNCREKEGWDHAPGDGGFILPVGCEHWTSNRPILIEESAPLNRPPEYDGDVGSGWTNDQPITTVSGLKQRPAIATRSDGSLVSAVERIQTSGYVNISLYESTDYGQTWDFLATHNISDDCSFPAIAVNVHTDAVAVVFQRESLVNANQIQGFVYNDGSVTGFTVDMDSGDDIEPRIAAEYHYGVGNRLYVSYEHVNNLNNREVHVARSLDGGLTWSEWHNRGYGGNLAVHTRTDISVSNGSNVFLTYVKGADDDSPKDLIVEYGDRSDTAAQFPNQVTVYDASANGDQSAMNPAIQGSHYLSTHCVVVFEQERPDFDHSSICCAFTFSGGSVWGWDYVSSNNDHYRRYPAISVDGMGSDSQSVDGYYHCTWWDGEDNTCRYKRATIMAPDSWSSWDDIIVNDSSRNLADRYRFGEITTQTRDDGAWYPCVTFTGYNGMSCYHVTKRAHPYHIQGDQEALVVVVDGETLPWGGQTFNNWTRGSTHTLYAPDHPPLYFISWSDGGAQTHDIITTGGTATETIEATYGSPTPTPTPSPSPTPVCPGELHLLVEDHEDGDDWGETSGPVWIQDPDAGCLVVTHSNPLDPGSTYTGRVNAQASVASAVDATEYDTIRLSVDLTTIGFEVGDLAFSLVSTDSGASWITCDAYSFQPWTHRTYDLSAITGGAADNNPDLMIMFAVSASGGTKALFLDNVVILGCPIMTPTPTQTPTPTPECIHHGDVNFSGSITAADAQTAFYIVLGTYTPTYEESCAADCNGSGTITSADAQLIFFTVLGTDACVDPL